MRRGRKAPSVRTRCWPATAGRGCPTARSNGPRMRILALDVGTSAIKAAVLETTTAEPVGPITRQAYPLDHPTPDAAELQPDKLWAALTAAARGASRGLDGVAGVGL